MAKEKTTTINGIMLSCTRYDNTAMDTVFGSLFVPVVSSKDTIFMKRIFEKSHSMFILKNQDLLTSNHLRLSQTLQAAIRGITRRLLLNEKAV